MTDVPIDGRRYRLNVGVVVFNREGKVWLGRRADGQGPDIWQFPQGGVDKGEDLLEAARRELFEETGIRSTALIARAPGWITYDFPEGFKGSKASKGYAGQTQAWFAFRFTGDDAEIDMNAHKVAEFDAWRWADLDEAPKSVVGFKREAYAKVVGAFGDVAHGAPAAAPRGGLLMIHGAGCSGAAMSRFAAEFEQKGWRVRAPTLKPAARRKTLTPKLAALTLGDYVEEAAGWAQTLHKETGTRPVVIGHSMGGLITQKLLERNLARAGVLVTPASPAGAPRPFDPRVLFTFANVVMNNGGRGGAKIWRRGFMWGVLNRVPARRREEIYADALFEAAPVWRALSNPAAAPNGAGKVDAAQVKAPVLTIAAGRDRAVPASWARGVAALYAEGGGRLMEYPDHGHWIIDEPGSDAVAADVDAWLQAVLA